MRFAVSAVISRLRRLAANLKLIWREEMCMPSDGSQHREPASLNEMQFVFDQAWAMLQTTGAALPDHFTPQREELAGIVIKLMREGRNESPSLAQDAVDEFMMAHRRA